MPDIIRMTDRKVRDILERKKQVRQALSWEDIKRQKSGSVPPEMVTDKPFVNVREFISDNAWKNRRCFIIGGGRSLKGFNFDRLGQELTIGVNRAFEYIDPSIILWMDYQTFYTDLLDGEFGEKAIKKFHSTHSLKMALNISGYNYPSEVYSIKRAGGRGFLSESLKDGLVDGDNVGYLALNLAVVLGANPIYLLGFDMKGDGKGKQAWFHSGYRKKSSDKVYKGFMDNFEAIAPELKERKIKVVNLNPKSEMKCFEFGEFDEVKKINNSELISVVMPTYNQGKYIQEAIESILTQTHKNFELIIVNDGSTDGTEETIKGFSDKRIKYIKKKNGGTGSALNMGFKIAKGKYETWFSSDSVMYPNCLGVLLESLTESPEGFVYGKSDSMNKGGKERRPLNVRPFDRDLLLETCYLGIAYMWKKDLRIKAGSRYAKTPSEDLDMHLRMSEVADFKHISPTLAGWRNHPENLTQTTTLPSGWKDHYRFIDEAKKRRERPFFSIMTVTYNRPELFKETLESIKKQTFERFEVLIVSKSDDPDTDRGIVESLEDKRFKWLGALQLPVYTVRNKLIDKAKGLYITVLDDDDLFPENALKDRREFILKHYAPDFIYSDYTRFEDITGGQAYHKARPLTAGFILDHKGTRGKMIGANLTIWASILKEMKYDDVVFPNNTADCDLAIRLLKAPLRFNVLNKATYMYRRHVGQGSFAINHDMNYCDDLWVRMRGKYEWKQ